jgi:DNA replicative helicase MCM subunit Mcm2 (Cdc46/Mcm family)
MRLNVYRAQNAHRKVITATPRQLESLIRLSEALAKMRFSAVVEKSDVFEAKRLMAGRLNESILLVLLSFVFLVIRVVMMLSSETSDDW